MSAQLLACRVNNTNTKSLPRTQSLYQKTTERSRFGLAWIVHLPARGVAMTTALSTRDLFVLANVRHEPDREPPAGRPAATGLDAATVIQALRTISGEILTDKLVETLMRTAIQHAGVERGVLIVRRAEEAGVEAEAPMRRGAIVVRRLDTLPERSDLPDTVVRYVLRTHETVLLDDASTPNPFSTDPHVAEHRVRSLLCLPLVNRGTLIGALYFEDRAASHAFTASRIEILRLLASQAAIALENARLYAQLRSENSLLREELQKTSTFEEQRGELRRTIDAIPHAITILGPDGSTLGANAFVLDYTGLSLEEVTDEDSRVRRFHPDDVARLEEERRQAFLRGEPFETEERARRKDGQYRWFLIRYNPVRDDDGHIIRWYATGTDIDDRKRAEDRVRSENLALREEVDRSSMFEEIVGASPPLRTVLSQV